MYPFHAIISTFYPFSIKQSNKIVHYAALIGHENKECLRSHDIDGRGEAETVKHSI